MKLGKAPRKGSRGSACRWRATHTTWPTSRFQGKEQLDVTDKYSGQVAYRVAVASPEEISRCAASGILPTRLAGARH